MPAFFISWSCQGIASGGPSVPPRADSAPIFEPKLYDGLPTPSIPQFDEGCPLSPAADRPMPVRNAGTSTMVTCSPVRSRSAAATRMTKTGGNGIAVSIRAHTQANIRTEPPPASTKPAPISKPRGRFFWRSEPRLTFRRGVASKIGPLEKFAMRQAGEKLPSQKPSTLMKCVCGHDLCNGAKNQTSTPGP